ncbi:MAG: ferritin family protein [bacterium]
MAVLFSAREIVEAAIEKERKRRGFYSTVSELSQGDDTRGLFQFLAEEEMRHIETFSKIRDRLPEESHSPWYTEEMQAYMDGVIDGRLYAGIDTTEFVQRAIDDKEVFRLAIGFEKDSILYFREFRPYVSESDQKVVAELIEQEKGHIRKLAELKKRLAQ